MFVSGFTFIRNAVKFDYPAEASIRSLLPLVDELIVCLGNSEDDTESLINSIGDPKIKVVHSVWDDSLREGGKVLALETNKALDAVSPQADWCIYLQAWRSGISRRTKWRRCLTTKSRQHATN